MRPTSAKMNVAMTVLLPLLLLICVLTPQTLAGCYQRRLCCAGRNNTCKSTDDGIAHLPTASPIRRPPSPRVSSSLTQYTAYQMPHYEASGDGYDLVFPDVYEEGHDERIGKLVMPDVVELEGSGAEDIFNKYGPEDDHGPAKLVKPAQKNKTSKARKITHLLFGKEEKGDEEPEEITKYTDGKPKHLLIRYSVLAQHLPLTVSTSSPEEEDSYRIQYLESAPVDCYCDETCVSLGDCCSDYTFVCPPSDCQVEEWSSWSGCTPDNGRCGMGEQQRLRRVIVEAERGGAACPALNEMRTCHKPCPTSNLDDITTVALLIDYKWNSTRSRKGRNNVYWDHPNTLRKLNQTSYYCVEYEIGWVNRNCWPKASRLHRGNKICAECQPEAQLHRPTPRCASDLEDGDEGFWKLIGPKSCNGIWRRLKRHDNCRCSSGVPQLAPFLLV